MNNTNKLFILSFVLVLFTTVWAVSYAYQVQWQKWFNTNQQINCDVSSLTQEILTPEIEEGLIFMIEEEKLARDVYLYFADFYGEKIFSNIARAEQQHMDKVALLLKNYWIQEPIGLSQTGEFSNQELQSLYDNLLRDWLNSLESALSVWITIEEKDIEDLDSKLIALTNWSDIYTVFSNLKKWSLNHLNSFMRNLEKQKLSSNNSYYENNQIKQWKRKSDMQSKNYLRKNKTVWLWWRWNWWQWNIK